MLSRIIYEVFGNRIDRVFWPWRAELCDAQRTSHAPQGSQSSPSTFSSPENGTGRCKRNDLGLPSAPPLPINRSLLTNHYFPHGRGCGVGRVLGIGIPLGVGVGLTVAVGVAVAVAVGEAVAVGVGVTVGVGVLVGVGVALGDAVGVGVGVAACPPGNTRT